MESIHTPVLLAETIEALDLQPGMIVVDGTLGGGGHTGAIVERIGAAGRVIALDRDEIAVERARERFADRPVLALQASFADLPEILAQQGVARVDRVLLDLGLSSDQLADESRGFSFRLDGPLDLRFDTSMGEPASKLLARLSERHLADLIYAYGEERLSRRIARRIVEQRRLAPIVTTSQLAELVRRCVPRAPRTKGGARAIDPATRTFQALRIAVNQELEALDTALRRIPGVLPEGGRLAVISFHSLEDRRVKEAFRDDDCYKALTRKPIRPTDVEVLANPRARSSRLRVAERTGEPEGFGKNSQAGWPAR